MRIRARREVSEQGFLRWLNFSCAGRVRFDSATRAFGPELAREHRERLEQRGEVRSAVDSQGRRRIYTGEFWAAMQNLK